MAYTGLGLLLILLLSCMLTITAVSVIHNCAGSSNSSRYVANLDLLLSSLSSNATSATGFYNASTGDGSDKVYGLFLCRGDTTTKDCQNCVKNGTKEVKSLCSNTTTAIVWYDDCMIRYSNESFSSILQQDPVFYLYNLNSVTNLDQYNQTVGDLMNRLVKEAAYGSTTPKYYAADEVNYYTGSHNVYGLVQCTPDITPDECNGCLNGSVALDIPHILYPKMGGRVLKPSCNIRYEFDSSFYRQIASDPASPPQASSPLASAPSTNSTSSDGTRIYSTDLMEEAELSNLKDLWTKKELVRSLNARVSIIFNLAHFF
ncbi:hypothetical protein NE237_000384 [Protea cynaroides]|uniref:Gnk2-homologous domain-containing protein n=1 Tax=Protea cynaroides TaxID=273540 RepID=A0A9Q0KR51_9MAGN|nr:hypothetical protein NE237_000384 [Protea cynaroides]